MRVLYQDSRRSLLMLKAAQPGDRIVILSEAKNPGSRFVLELRRFFASLRMTARRAGRHVLP